MKKITITIIVAFILVSSINAQNQNVIITDNPLYTGEGSAMLDVFSIAKGLLIPRLTQSRRDLIFSPATGLLIYQTNNTPGFYYYNGSSWVDLQSAVIGINDLTDGKTGGHSVFLGQGAGENDDGIDNFNVGVGDSALYKNNTGNKNTALGYQSLKNTTSGWNNVAVGHNALKSNITGVNNLGIGPQSLELNESGNSNVSLGSLALLNNVSGGNNTALGQSALSQNTASENTAVGAYSLIDNTSGTGNIAIGYYAFRRNNTGSENTVIGYEAGKGGGSSPSAKDYNVIIGYQSGYLIGSGSCCNVLLGHKAGYNINDNSDANVILGYKAGYNITDGDEKNVFIGYMAGWGEEGSEKLYIENSGSTTPLIGGDFDADEVYINGSLGIDTIPTSKIDISGSSGYNQLRLRTPYTPTSATDPNGEVGDICWDEDYLYIKTASCCWQRIGLLSW